MCQTREDDKTEKEHFVDSAIRKKLRNKRKRDPDMRVEAVLECTVRRLYAEILGLSSCTCPSPKRRKISQDHANTKRTDCQDNKMDCEENESGLLKEVSSNLEDSTTLSRAQTPAQQTSTVRNTSKPEELPKPVVKRSPKDEEIDFDSLLQSISELADCTAVSNEDMDIDINELLQELACEPSISCKDEDLVNNSDPFLPGIFEILCS